MQPRHDVSADEAAAMRRLATAILVFLVAATLPYAWLVRQFGYDDILREPTGSILAAFHAGGESLVLAWLAFAMSSLLFIPVALGFDRWLELHPGGPSQAAQLGVGSAVVQAIGLLRWVLVVPALATGYVDPVTTAASREAIVLVFEAVHRYGGMVLGEMVGQLLLAAWTGLVSWRVWASRRVPRWPSAIGLLVVPLWLLGQTELLHHVVPSVPAIEVVPLAFMLWEGWLLAQAVTLLAVAWQSGAAPRTTGAAGSTP